MSGVFAGRVPATTEMTLGLEAEQLKNEALIAMMALMFRSRD